VEAWDLRSGREPEAVWTLSGGAAVVAMAQKTGTLFIFDGVGFDRAVNVTDGAGIWSVSSGIRIGTPSRAAFEYGQFYVLSANTAIAFTGAGKLLWSLTLPDSASGAVLGDDGTVYASAPGWRLNAWSGERRIALSSSGNDETGYGILNAVGRDTAWLSPPDTDEVRSFFSLVSDSLARGAGKGSPRSALIGVDEPRWARMLASVVRGTPTGLSLGPGARQGFFETERARAASLLGQMGSSEYRDFLTEQASGKTGETFALGLLYGLAATGGDREGKVAEAIRSIARDTGVANDSVNRGVCDALYALIRYAPDREAADYAAMLVAFTKSPYGESTRDYARQVIGNIVQ